LEFELEPITQTVGYGAYLTEVFGVFFGMAVSMLGFFFIVLAYLVSKAEAVGDGSFSKEFASRKRVPMFHLLLGAGLLASGIVVAFFPF
jgi:hypothetical protein